MLLAGSLSAMAQTAPQTAVKSLKAVTIEEKAEAPAGKDSLRTTTTTIGKGQQELRDIPQSVTVVTEKLIDDRNLDTLKEVLHNTAGVTFLAAEGGEEDIRLRGFSLATTGDIFVDGMRDPAFYERDTFNSDRIELLRGSASMLFGRGSTGGAVNQVSKQARTMDESEVSTTLGSFNYARITGDFNLSTGEDSGLRINAMATQADNNGSGSRLGKKGLAATYRFGIGTQDEFSVGIYSLINNNGMNYGLPWIRPTAASTVADTTQIDPSHYYGLSSDYNDGSARNFSVSHTHRFDENTELKTALRGGTYTRDQRASLIRYCTRSATNPLCPAAIVTLDTFTPSTVLTRANQTKIQDLDSLYGQSDYSSKFNAWGMGHHVMAGVDFGREGKNVYAAAAITKPNTAANTPNDGASVPEWSRTLRKSSAFAAQNLGVYAQDMVSLTPTWKVLGGLRYDTMRGAYDVIGTTSTTSYQQTIDDWSPRVGLLYQPNALHSYHFSWGTSFNTSADTYSYSALSANTAPEKSRNIEIGAKLDTADKRFTTRLALFQSTKYNERNTDPDSAATAFLLSGQRHASGFEIDLTGRLTPSWEVFGSYMWMPDAVIDIAAPTAGAGDRAGERPALTPVHSGTVWTTYQLNPQWRVGGGLNFRSEQSPNRNPGFMAKAFATLDLMAEYTHSETVSVKANLSNVTNALYADALYTAFYVPGMGRNAQVTLNVKF
ncbi:MAG: TonB-dependent siderophore receptor [Burkholderiales bacterium PBB4]|nr:MAG: TonB-dependent siderophore receptor [Burkholderiales bacterium PBB4]